jgi:hypothetical protein
MAKPKGENSNQPRLPTLLWSFGGPATRSPYRRRVAEPEGFEPSIGLYNPITV